MKNNGNLFISYAFPGGYPVFYLDASDVVTCPNCANKANEYGFEIIAADVNYEDPNLYCTCCNERIESAYAEIE